MARLQYKSHRRTTVEKVQATALDARSQKAWRAVRVFTQMLPQLTSFARMATGNSRVAVRLGRQGDRAATDGTVIYLQPPIDLGTERVHTRHLCDRRGPNKRQLCKACDAREVVLFYLFHEIAHIAFDSMAVPMRYNVDKIDAMLDEWHPPGCPHHSIVKVQLDMADSYLKLCAVHNGFLPILFNCLEDARVNARMFQARPGLRIMFDAGTHRVFDQGVTENDGTTWKWAEKAFNPQVMIGLFLLSSGTTIEPDFFAPEVAETLQDPVLQKLCSRVIMTRSPHQIMDVTLELFRRLNEMGYLVVPKCAALPPPPPAEQDDEEQDANQQSGGDPGESDGGSSSSTVPPGDADEETESQSLDDDRSDGGPGSEESSESEDQQDAGGSSSAPTAPHDDSGDDDSDDGDESGSRGGPGGPGSNEEDSTSEDDASADEALRGSDHDHEEPESEDQSGSSPQGTGSGGDGDDNDRDDPSDLDGEGDASSPASNEDDRLDPQSGDSDSGQSSGEGDETSDATSKEADGDEDDEDGDDSGDPADSEGDEGSSDGLGDGPDPEEDAEAKPTGESVWDDPDGYEPEPERPVGSDYGDPSEVADLVNIFGGHAPEEYDADGSGIDHEHFGDEDHDHEDGLDSGQRQQLDRQAVQAAARQSAVFDMQSIALEGLDIWTFPQPKMKWDRRAGYPEPAELESSERVMGSAVMRARLVFEDNRRAKEQRHLKSGGVDSRVLGKRAPLGDPRLFSRRTMPGKKDYFFAIGVDCSGSTDYGLRNPRIKRAVMAQAQLFSRVGVNFAIYGMTGGDPGEPTYSWNAGMNVWMLEIKSPDQPWDTKAKERLACLPPCYENFDGHNFEFLRKILDQRTEARRGIIYYTDGQMPAANAVEELLVLQSELLTMNKKRYIGLAVGINTDSPREYGLDTVQVDSDEDIQLVVNQLGKRLTER